MGWDGAVFSDILGFNDGCGWLASMYTDLLVRVDRLKVNAYCSMVFTRFGFEVVMIGSRR